METQSKEGTEIPREGEIETQGKGRDPEKVGDRADVGGKQRCRKRGWRFRRQTPRERGKDTI